MGVSDARKRLTALRAERIRATMSSIGPGFRITVWPELI